MAKLITMPRLSDTMTEGAVAKWLKNVGDQINEGDIIAEIETDKATMEFEAFESGILLYQGIKEGETAPIDSPLAILGKAGEDFSHLLSSPPAPSLPNPSIEGALQEGVEKTTEKAIAVEHSTPAAIPAGVTVVTMPRLSDTMTDGTVATWLKKVGDQVNEGDILAEIETDKATMEFESFNKGTLLYIGVQEGQTAPVDSILAVLGPAGTNVDAVVAGFGAAPVAVASNTEAPATAVAQEATVIAQPATSNARIFASPLAKKLASDKNIDLASINGSGENGRITKKDVENYQPTATPVTTASPVHAVSAPTTTAVAEPIFIAQGETQTEQVANSQMRKTIAKRLAESKFTAPHYYLTVELDMDEAIKEREIINSLPDMKVSFNDMVLKACAMALKKHPKVNSQWTEQATLLHHHVHLGVAVAVEDGLVVPVVKHANQLTLSQIGAQVKDMAVRAKAKKIQPQEMEGSTFTVSNLGMFGISEFTSIINQPNSAILSVGAIVQKPVVKNNQIVVGNTMTITLACDHRTVDGATGAQFLQTLRHYIEKPVSMIA
jgi:pyruvate dehydrogenase E2 component (dihydrolipoamide acetyltransferase)